MQWISQTEQRLLCFWHLLAFCLAPIFWRNTKLKPSPRHTPHVTNWPNLSAAATNSQQPQLADFSRGIDLIHALDLSDPYCRMFVEESLNECYELPSHPGHTGRNGREAF